MSDFSKALTKLIGAEGAYANNPNDRGQETYFGISRRSFPQWIGWKTIDGLRTEPGFPKTLGNVVVLTEQVKDLYKQEFWDKIHGDEIKSQDIANEIFDTAVNMGCDVAIRFAQHALNLLNRNQKNYSDLNADGVFGKLSLNTLNNFDEELILLRALNALQANKYITLCDRDSSQEVFFRGWLKRAS